MNQDVIIRNIEEKKANLIFLKKKKSNLSEEYSVINNLLKESDKNIREQNEDIKNFEETNFINLFYKFTNNLDKKLSQKEQDLLESKLKHDELVDSLETLKAEIKNLDKEIETSKEEIKSLVHSAENNNPEFKNTLNSERELITALKAEIIELDEAINLGIKIEERINLAIESLSSAKNWATYDMFARGGILSHMIKYDRIDTAKEHVNGISTLMDRFKDELKDVNISFNDFLSDYSDSTRFIDYFFDNIFTDFSIKSHISDDIDKFNSLKHKIQDIVDELYNRKRIALGDIDKLTL